MDKKLFHQTSDFKLVDEDIPLEDPNALGNRPQSIDVVEHLNWLADQAYAENNRTWEIADIDFAIDSLEGSVKLSHTSASILFTALENMLKGSDITINLPTLESFISDTTLMPTVYAEESIKETAQKLGSSFASRVKKLLDAAVGFHETVLTKVGRNETTANKLLEKIKDLEGVPSHPTIEVPTHIAKFLVNGNVAGAIHAMNSVILSSTSASGVENVWEKRLNQLNELNLGNVNTIRDELSKFAKSIGTEDIVDLLVSELTKHDFKVVSDSGKDSDEAGIIVLQSKHGLLGKVFLTITLQYSSGRQYINSSHLSYVSPNSKSLRENSQDTTFNSLNLKQIEDALLAVVEICRNVKNHSEDSKTLSKVSGEIEYKVEQLYEQLLNIPKDLKGSDDFYIVRNYLQSIFNTIWLLNGPSDMVAKSSMDVIDAQLYYINKSIRNIDSHPVNH